jgi:molecular chaperone HtpG
MNASEAPIIITQPEFIRRMMEQQKMGGGGGFYGAFPEIYSLVVNSNHPKVSEILNAEESVRGEKAKQLADLALLSQGLLKGEALNSFIERSIELV